MFKPAYNGQTLVAELGYQELVTITTALRVYAEGQTQAADDMREVHDQPKQQWLILKERALLESAKRAQDLRDLLAEAHPDKAYFTTER